MKRNHRQLDRKSDEESEENERGASARAGIGMGSDDRRKIERPRRGPNIQRQNREQHRQSAEARVEKKLHRCFHPLSVSPQADDEVHRHERDLEEQIEEEEVE